MNTWILAIAAIATTLLLAACGGGGGDTASTGNVPPDTSIPATATALAPAIPAPRAADVTLSPIFQDGGTLQVGTEISPSASLSPVSGRPGTSWGRLRDGEGRADVVSYIEQVLEDLHWYPENSADMFLLELPPNYPGLARFPSPPTVRIAANATPDQIQTVYRGLQIINDALPPAWHLRIGPPAPPAPPDPWLPDGQIHVFFSPQQTWPGYSPGNEIVAGIGGGATWRNRDDDTIGAFGSIHIDPNVTSGADMLHVFGHELLHALGFREHVTGLESILNNDSDGYRAEAPFPIDREALRAAYMHLEWSDDADAVHAKLGDWSDTSTHLAGQAGAAAFGAAHRNGFVRPWAAGPAPRTNLADSPLRGRVAWNGELLGFTPAGAPVAGDAAIGVDLSTLAGTASFESLETWAAGNPPGTAGTGTAWGDGDLDYRIAVRGNTFRRTGGDAGVLTGVFVGAGHEGAAGTLERDDLSAGFGASRR